MTIEKILFCDTSLSLAAHEDFMANVSPLQKEAFIAAAKALKGSDRRLFMARIVKSLGFGGLTLATKSFGWDQKTIQKGIRELEHGVIKDNFSARGRKKAEEHLPNLLSDIRVIADRHSQTDSTFRTTQLYTRFTASAVRQALIDEFDYTNEELPSSETIRRKLNEMGYRLRTVRKSEPKKKSQKPMPSLKN